jgi:Uma2 family endonuclease
MGIGQYFYKNSTNCRAFAAPFDVRLYDKQKSKHTDQPIYTVVQPDMCIICDTNKLDEQGCQGAPDLIVEILSKGNSKKEMRLKKDLYEENQVREYWVFDPERESVTQFVLNEQGIYKTVNFVFSDEILTSAIFEGLKIDLSQIFMP